MLVAAAKITRADLPNDVAAVGLVVRTEAALAGVVGEAAALGADVEGPDRIRTQCAEAHGGDVEDGDLVFLAAIGPANRDAERQRGDRLRRDRMAQPFETFGIDVVLSAERTFIEHHLGPLI